MDDVVPVEETRGDRRAVVLRVLIEVDREVECESRAAVDICAGAMSPGCPDERAMLSFPVEPAATPALMVTEQSTLLCSIRLRPTSRRIRGSSCPTPTTSRR